MPQSPTFIQKLYKPDGVTAACLELLFVLTEHDAETDVVQSHRRRVIESCTEIIINTH